MPVSLGVIDHGAGNLVSIAQGLRAAGSDVTIITAPDAWDRFDGIVLPGVGATATAMRRLDEAGLTEALRAWTGPLLGICVGLQLFFEHSEEDDATCLGILSGSVARLEGAPRLPHIGWNDVTLSPDPLFDGVPDGTPFYFVHSFAPRPAEPGVAVAHATYGSRFVAAARIGPAVGVQFHPERSGGAGLRILDNFARQAAAYPDAA